VLVGEAGTGKGVVLGAAREAWERDGHRVIGTAVAGAAAQRLGTEAGFKETMTADAIAHRVRDERLLLDSRSVVVFDEAGMADTRRLAQVVELTHEADAKLILAGDQAQAVVDRRGRPVRRDRGARADRAAHRGAPRQHEWEREAWGRLREGDAETALAAYQAHGRLHLEETRSEAGRGWSATGPQSVKRTLGSAW